MKITVRDFVQKFNNQKFINIKTNPNEKSEFITKELEIRTYIPFKKKREIAELIVSQNITIDDGIKKIDTINQYISFIISMISTHTNLQWGDDPIADYDLLSESKLLPQIIAEFRESYDECEAMLKMVVAKELEDNNVNVLIGKFLDSILNKLDTVTGGLSSAIKNIDLKSIIGDEDLTKFIGLLDKLK